MLFRVYENLKIGSNDENQISTLQAALVQQGYLTDFTRGVFGSSTNDSVRAFQSDAGFSVDGIAGEVTCTALGIWSNITKGFDASHWNNLNFNYFPADMGFSFGIFKATEGSDLVDPLFQQYVLNSKKIGLNVGAYHFTHFSNSPFEEAEFFLSTLSTSPLSFSLFKFAFLDVESCDDKDPDFLSDWIDSFTSIVGIYLNVGVYTSARITRTYKLQNKLQSTKDKILWAADWNSQPYVAPFGQWDIWQYTNKGDVGQFSESGYLDLNRSVL